MFEQKKQDVGDNSVAVQADRDAVIVTHNYGLSVGEVRELAQLFLEKNLPVLREEAAKVARENADKFLSHFALKLQEPNGANPAELAEPDVQAALSAAVIGSAKKGEKIDLDMLADLVVRRLETGGNSLLSLVAEEAIQVVPKLSAQHVAFLAYAQYIKHVRHTSFTEIEQLERVVSRVVPVVQQGLTISAPNREYLESVGVMTINRVSDANNIVSNFCSNYPFFPKDGVLPIEKFPNLKLLMDAYGELEVPMVSLNTVGKLIGLMALQRALGRIDMAIWIH